MITFKEYQALLLNYLKPQKLKSIMLAIVLISGSGMSLLNPQILRHFIDTATSQGSLNTLLWLGVLFVGASLASQVLSIIMVYLGETVGWTATNALRVDLLNHCLRLDMSFHNKHTSGEMIERIDGDCNNLFAFFSGFVFQLVSSFVLWIGVMILLFIENLWIGSALMIFSVVTIFILIRTRGIATPWGRKELMARTNLLSFLEERVSGISDLHSSGGTPHVLSKFFQLHSSLFLAARKAWAINRTSTWGVSIILFAIGNIITFAISISLYRHGDITIGTIYLLFYYMEMLFRPLENITNHMQNLQSSSASIQRLNELRHTISAIQDNGYTKLSSGPVDVLFHKVSFAYGEKALVLEDVSFHLQPGKVLGVLGRTGSGKTTLTRLLFRMYEPTSGAICLNDTNIQSIPLSHLHQRIGIVTQEVQIIQGSIRDNLTFFNTSISDETILAAIDRLGLNEWFGTLKHGLNTELKSSGEGLSAGEAQLLAFTRVFLKDPSLIILDEFSSRLDVMTERWIERAVSGLFKNRTGIIIAHRLSTIQHVDEIMLVEEGTIVEYGGRKELAEDSHSKFHQLLKTGLEVQLA
jgi:ATP-binding cassette subfamily B protein